MTNGYGPMDVDQWMCGWAKPNSLDKSLSSISKKCLALGQLVVEIPPPPPPHNILCKNSELIISVLTVTFVL